MKDQSKLYTFSLEKEKLNLIQTISKEKIIVSKVQAELCTVLDLINQAKVKLGDYNAHGIAKAACSNRRAPNQRLGAKLAVSATKKIIRDEIDQLRNAVAVVDLKSNKLKVTAKETKKKIDTLRGDRLSLLKLFSSTNEELSLKKQQICSINNEIQAVSKFF